MKRILPLILALMMLLSAAFAEDPANTPVATVNGEVLTYGEYYAIESAYLANYEAAGIDLTDDATYAYLQDLALTYAIEQMLVKQDMTAQGCYAFDAEQEAWFVQQGRTAYSQALNDVISMYRSADATISADEAEVYALAYASALGVTEQSYVDYYRDQYASAQYYQWLTRNNPVTDEDVQTAYEARVADSKALYEQDAAAFELALSNNKEAWYRPAGYRSVLQILLPAQGADNTAKLASVQTKVDDIYARLEKGESFQTLIAEYGQDANFQNADFLSAGYQVHKDSVIWDEAFIAAAFSEEMVQPGCWSQPLISDLGVHILYYLNDVTGGPIELTENVYDALAFLLYEERYIAARKARVTELADAAEILFH